MGNNQSPRSRSNETTYQPSSQQQSWEKPENERIVKMSLSVPSINNRQESYKYVIDFDCPIHCLPREIVLLILSFVTGRDLVKNVSVVCKYWLDLTDRDDVWRLKCQNENITFPSQASLVDFDEGFQLDYRQIYFYRPYERNLVKNWNAAEKLSDWTVKLNGGNGFGVEPNLCSYSEPVETIGIPDCRHCWVTSFGWCRKSQEIDLVAAGCSEEILDKLKPIIEISDWTAARKDCGSQYELEVKLLSASGDVLDKFETSRVVGQWQPNGWHKMSHTFHDYRDGVRRVSICHGGKDTQFWSGHYGPKMTATSVILRLK